jgi:hypothetical protein
MKRRKSRETVPLNGIWKGPLAGSTTLCRIRFQLIDIYREIQFRNGLLIWLKNSMLGFRKSLFVFFRRKPNFVEISMFRYIPKFRFWCRDQNFDWVSISISELRLKFQFRHQNLDLNLGISISMSEFRFQNSKLYFCIAIPTSKLI